MMRAAAIFLLAFMCLDLGMDLWHGETGDFDSQEIVLSVIGHGHRPAVVSAATPNSNSGDSVHECFCCCSHLEAQGSLIVSVILEINPGYSDSVARSLDPELFHSYPPPQSIL